MFCPLVLLMLGGGCTSFFNPSFVNLLAADPPEGLGVPVSGDVTIDNAPGHVPIILVNNTQFDDRLLEYMEDIGLDVGDADIRPRIRLRMTVEYTTGSQNTIEFIDGAPILQTSLDTEGGTEEIGLAPADVRENDLDNAVAICDVTLVTPQPVIEVFVPVFLKEITVTTTDFVVVRELEATIPPRFVSLQPDTVDDQGDILTIRNYDVRDAPVPAVGPQCGGVVGFTVSGVLAVPFVEDELGQTLPGYLVTDTTAQAALPGRYSFLTTVR
jgi:hypothetical protein